MSSLSVSYRLRTFLGLLLVAATLAVSAAPRALAQTYTVLYTFKGSPDGGQPNSGVLRDVQGNLYGATFTGGTGVCKGYPGCGVVYRIDSTGKESVLHSFEKGQGGFPPSPHVDLLDRSGLYGTVERGGAPGHGSVFQISPAGQLTGLYDFLGGSRGATPSLFARDPAGNLYGTTLTGGNSSNGGFVFQLSQSGGAKALYEFTCNQCYDQGGSGFGIPGPSIVSDRTLYGVASGGAHNSGVVYQLSGAGAKVLYNFGSGENGWDPAGPLVRDSAGNLYGSTVNNSGSFCDASSCGIVFKLDPSGQETTLYSFGGGSDGGHPNGGLVRDAQGNLYGTTWIGGSDTNACGDIYNRGCGVVFKVDPSGKETVLYTFDNQAGGGYPNGDLVMDQAGNLYGTTTTGGDPACNCGVVFKLTP